MRSVTIILSLSLCVLVVAGCGTNFDDPTAGRSNVTGSVTLAEARATCLTHALDVGSGADSVDTAFLLAEAARDDGMSRSEYMDIFLEVCSPEVNPAVTDVSACVNCTAQVAAVVWN